ncbi:MAG: 3-deoxy-D-manno-octulosonic acid transferase [Candidatus Goldiibacteriota bacterium]
MIYIYNILLDLLFVITLPFIAAGVLARRKNREGFFERLGFISNYTLAALKQKPVMWFHAASVGETQALIPVLKEIKKMQPGYNIFVTTTSNNGKKRIIKELPEVISHACLLPLDMHFIMGRFVKKISPLILVIVETEIWPNLIFSASRRNIPVVMVNGRISGKSFGGYRFFRMFFRKVLDQFTVLVMQNEKMAVRLRALGVKDSRMIMIRNTKYSADSGALSGKFDIRTDGKTVIVGGSIRKGEEKTVIKSFAPHREKAVLFIAPRHLERTAKIEKILHACGLSYDKWSRINTRKIIEIKKDAVIVDTIGQLDRLYEAGDIAVIGGGFLNYGGHNPMEAALNSMPVIMGENMHNFEDTAEQLVSGGGAFMTGNIPEEISEKLGILIDDAGKRAEMGKKNRDIVEHYRGTAETTALIVNEILLESSVKGETNA